jgi:DNA repair ATPase RecN
MRRKRNTTRIAGRLEALRDAEEGVRIAEAHLRYWKIQASSAELERRVNEGMTALAAAQRAIDQAQHEHAIAPARVLQAERRLEECRTALTGMRHDREVQKLVRMYKELMENHQCVDNAMPYYRPDGSLGPGRVCGVCGGTVE